MPAELLTLLIVREPFRNAHCIVLATPINYDGNNLGFFFLKFAPDKARVVCQKNKNHVVWVRVGINSEDSIVSLLQRFSCLG